MQNRSSDKLLQESYTQERPLREDTLREARDVVANAVILNPTMPAVQLARYLAQHAEPELATSLNEILAYDFYTREIRKERRKQSTAAQPMFPGFDLIPATLPTADHKRVGLMDANYSDIRAYCWYLAKQRSQQARNDPKLKQARALKEKMRRYAVNEKGITVRQVLALERL